MQGSFSKDGIEFLENKYGKQHFSRWTTDSIETVEDLNLLYDVLNKFKNDFEAPPKITGNFITHNINYNNKTDLTYLPLSNYLSYNPELKKIYYKGIADNLLCPQLHGFSHYNHQKLVTFLNTDLGQELFDVGFVTGFSTMKNIRNELKGELILQNNIGSITKKIQSSVEEFHKLFGYYSQSIIPPHFIFDLQLLKIIKKHNIKVIQACNRLVNNYGNRLGKIYFRRQKGIYWFPRNVRLDPHEDYGFYANECLSLIKKAFEHKMPAIIDFHRVNISGKYNPRYRDRTLKELSKVFDSISKNWPDAKFISTPELISICQSNRIER